MDMGTRESEGGVCESCFEAEVEARKPVIQLCSRASFSQPPGGLVKKIQRERMHA